MSIQHREGAVPSDAIGTALGPDQIALDAAGLSILMPMHLRLSAEGRIVGVGATLRRILGQAGQEGADFRDRFAVTRPTGMATVQDLVARQGQRLVLALVEMPEISFRGVGAAEAGGGVLLNLSFGIGIIEAVRRHGLTQADFAPTDLAVELLYLVEAKAAVTEELRRLTLRLDGARHLAEEEALTDTLTGLRNRRALFAALARACAGERTFGLMHLDLDHFKAVNDTLGHAAGDHVLREVAKILLAETRAADTVARIGGDEFVILLPEIDGPDVMRTIGQRIVDRVAKPFDFDGNPCRIGASLGLSFSGLFDEPDPDALLEDADRALYGAKRQGRGQIVMSAGFSRSEEDQSG